MRQFNEDARKSTLQTANKGKAIKEIERLRRFLHTNQNYRFTEADKNNLYSAIEVALPPASIIFIATSHLVALVVQVYRSMFSSPSSWQGASAFRQGWCTCSVQRLMMVACCRVGDIESCASPPRGRTEAALHRLHHQAEAKVPQVVRRAQRQGGRRQRATAARKGNQRELIRVRPALATLSHAW